VLKKEKELVTDIKLKASIFGPRRMREVSGYDERKVCDS
jgi:hypothetical protein